jgi:hypothetical protein
MLAGFTLAPAGTEAQLVDFRSTADSCFGRFIGLVLFAELQANPSVAKTLPTEPTPTSCPLRDKCRPVTGSASNARRMNAHPEESGWAALGLNSPLKLITLRPRQRAEPPWRFRQEHPKSRRDPHWLPPAPRRTCWSCDQQQEAVLVVSSVFSSSWKSLG